MKKEILLSYFPKLTPKRVREILAIFKDLENFWTAEFDELKKLLWDETLINEFLNWRDRVNEKEIAHHLSSHQIEAIGISEPSYPEYLRTIFDPPLCLFIRGEHPTFNNPIAFVGARNATPYGKQATEEIIRAFASHEIEIISGLAFGIDACAHEIALKYGLRTYAVLGSGVDPASVFPGSNRNLSERIISAHGALISEYPPGTLPTKYSFPLRNRIIAGLARGIVIVEATADSGSLITANYALDNAREVFAVPGNIFSPSSIGTNDLLKAGAHPCTKASDILETLSIRTILQQKKMDLPNNTDPIDSKILAVLSKLPKNINKIVVETDLPVATVGTHLTILELQGAIKNLGAKNYILA